MQDDPRFWFAVMGAAVAKLLMSEKLRWVQAISTSVVGVFCAYVFTEPVADFLGWTKDGHIFALAAMLTIVGENLLRLVLDASASKTLLADLIRAWRGK